MVRCALLVVVLAAVSACGDKKGDAGAGGGTGSSAGGTAAASALPESFWAASEPAGAVDVIKARASVKDGDEVTVVGKVGGAVKVFEDRRALFSVADLSLKDCYDMQDACKTPWDYCCVDPKALAAGMATIEFHDAAGLMKTSARGFHGLDHGKTVVVKGKAHKDAAGNLTVRASSIHVRS
jgi:hypothetical protein